MRQLGYTALDPRSLPLDLPLICNLYIRERGRYVLYREQLGHLHRLTARGCWLAAWTPSGFTPHQQMSSRRST